MQPQGEFSAQRFFECEVAYVKKRSRQKRLSKANRSWLLCPVLGLALFLKKWIRDGVGATSQWLFGNGASDLISLLREQDWEVTVTKNHYTTAI